jgi:hypothetical protein
MSENTRQMLRETFRPEVQALGDLLGMDMLARWNYL